MTICLSCKSEVVEDFQFGEYRQVTPEKMRRIVRVLNNQKYSE